MSSTTARHSIRRRPTRSIPAIIVAIALLAIAVAAIWAGTTALSGGSTAAVDSIGAAAGTAWSAQAAYLPAIIIAAIGLMLIVIALIPGRYDALLLNHHGVAEAALTTKALRTYLEDQASVVDGVDSARTTVKGRRAEVRIGTYALDHRDIDSAVQERLQRRTEALDLTHAPRIRTNARTLKD
ncbi:DUF6286 domain-containing protein [Arthrobacter sp. L77]|uniref:DUF6286 domain-containing protein n=1 Tax=Arthrobacter sp. L77 TaxID=1496689 RepID=UPI0006909E15|nr:DUF6286 domain-containing protein [Arthrobacter sp. L77]